MSGDYKTTGPIISHAKPETAAARNTRTFAHRRGLISSSVVAAMIIALSGCTALSAARRAGLDPQVITGSKFQHLVYARLKQDSPLFIFIEGDGTPWVNNGQDIASDPTPSEPLALELMLQTEAAAAYLGRPCYFGLKDTACTADYWTNKRYSDDVVLSMTAVVTALLQRSRASRCILIGHSGGGALALLIAARTDLACAVVTVAGLVDTDAWTQWHGYEPLLGSNNPARLSNGIDQIHLVGLHDTVVPPEQTRAAANAEAAIWAFETFDHVCCWVEDWPGIFARIEAGLELD